MASWKLVLLYAAWLFASVAIALVAALFVAEVAAVLGIVEPGTETRNRVVDVVLAVVFLLLAATPFLLRRRLSSGD